MAVSASPVVSVIIPTYNRAERLHVSVESVIAQTHRPIELLVIDDGSTDDTPAAMNRLEAQARAAGLTTVFVRKENGGCASARNVGLERATGEWIAFLDDDDRWLPEKTEKQLARLAATGAQACCAQVLKKFETKESVRPSSPDRLITGHNPGSFLDGRCDAHLISIMIHSDLLTTVGCFDTSLRISSDTEWVARLCHHVQFCAVPEVLAVYEWSHEALTRVRSLAAQLDRSRIQMRQLMLIRQQCSNLPGWDEEAWLRRAAWHYHNLVKDLLYTGKTRQARSVYLEGIALLGPVRPMRKVRKLLWKARLLGPLGWRLRHPTLTE